MKCDSRSEREKLAHNAMLNTISTLESRYDLKRIGSSEGADKLYYNSIGLYFQVFRELSKDEGRKILIDSIEELLKEINSDSQLQQFLVTIPFAPANVKIGIYAYHPNGKDIFYPGIGTFSFWNGKLHFNTNSPEKEYGYYTQEEESYEEALKIVHSQIEKHGNNLNNLNDTTN